VVIAGSFAGYIFSGYINDLLGRKATFAIYAICSGTIILSYTHFDITNTLMLILSFPLGFFASGIFSGFGPFLSELFSTDARGAGQGFTYNFGRGVAAFAPAIVGILSQYYGLAGGISIFGPAAYLLCLISLLFCLKPRELCYCRRIMTQVRRKRIALPSNRIPSMEAPLRLRETYAGEWECD
jgi:MFS family permease